MKLLLRLSPLALLLIATIPSRAQTVRDVISFTGQNQSGDPAMIPTQGRDGQLYGTSPNPRDTDGSDFRLSLGGELTVLYEFGSSANGVQPYAGITLGTDGNFYGTTSGGGSGQYGTLYKVTPRGVLTTLHSFSGQSDGSSPASAPTEGADGNFYGTTAGNAGNPATIYKYSPSSGSVTTIYQFDASHGEEVNSPLIQASDGYLYGVAVHGGASSLGTVFKISTSGQIIFCRSFTGKENGANPYGPLIEASDGLFYGMTNSGGLHSYGTAFKMDRDGHVSTFFRFAPPTSVYPLGGFVQGTDGYLYGALTEYTLPNLGSLFRLSLSGQYEQLYNFTATVGEYVGTSLMQHTNGAFYGSAEYGGAFGYGAIYTLDMHLPPFITFVRRNGKVGQSAQILGQGLKGATAVTFNDIPATSFSVETDTFMTAVVPSGATTGPVVVTTATGALTSNVNCQILK
jgi:uncharacterized repeat protein (TIGR03803 family)